MDKLIEEAQSELTLAKQQTLPPDDGALLERMGKTLPSVLGAEEPSFQTSRLSPKPPGVIVDCLKELILCPMKGELFAGRLDVWLLPCLSKGADVTDTSQRKPDHMVFLFILWLANGCR